ncbi:MAG TPA: methyl-accepting chemotaxis protein [Syntrophorhabdaceae bacterium]|nr:methyl-accepting chemotaxis protein [Syntrophorhabdaceae bacterium]
MIGSTKISKRILSIPTVASGFFAFVLVAVILDWKYVSLGIAIAGIIVCFLVAIFVSKSILTPIRKMNDAVGAVAGGDLTRRVPTGERDELGQVALNFNASLEKLHGILTHFAKDSYVVSSTAYTLDKAYKLMIAGMNDAVAQVNSVATAGEEMSTTSAEIAENCVSAAKSSEKANQSALTGQSVADGTLEVMSRVHTIVNSSAQIIEGLGRRSDEIGGVINLINDIADQTNLLALNAAIEAARAGEHGRGFAVVADEVRKLAEKTTQATKHIGETIKAMQSETQQAVTSMEEGVRTVETGTQEAKKSDGALKDILKQVGTVAAEINQIAVASEQQTATTNELAQNIQRISEAIKQTAENLNQNAGSISQMAELSLDIQKVVTQFKMATEEDGKRMVEKAAAYIKAHGREKAFEEFSNPRGEFVKNGLYIIAQDFNGTILLNGSDRSRLGKNLIDMQDPNGKYFVRETIHVAKTKGSGMVECVYLNAATKTLHPKVYYVQAMEDYVISCGVYK